MDWVDIQERYKNSVVQINVNVTNYSSLRPYSNGGDSLSSGTGFLIDSEKGLFITNAHVVENANNITCFAPNVGKQRIPMELESIIMDKDLALVKVKPKDLKRITEDNDPKRMEIEMGDDLDTRAGEPVLAMGYPLGEIILKVTTGIVSGRYGAGETSFNFEYGEDTFFRDVSYLTHSSPLNEGMSGGVLINKKGKAIGINSAGRRGSNNIGYAIGIRVLLANYPSMLKNKTPLLPTFNFRWSPMSKHSVKLLSSSTDANLDNCGIYVRKILPDSSLFGLEEGDIIKQITFEIDNINEKNTLRKLKSNNRKIVTGIINSFGDAYLYDGGPFNKKLPGKKDRISSERFSFAEMADIIPVGSSLTIVFERNKKDKKLTTTFDSNMTDRLRAVYPTLDKYEYTIAGGMCITPLLINQLVNLPIVSTLDDSDRTDDFVFQNHLIVTQVFPQTEVSDLGTISAGDVLTEVNGTKVETLKDLDKAMKKDNKGFVTFKTQNRSFLVLDRKEMEAEDKKITKSL